ncbi:hypothetical protein DNTS_022803 [Danionella cerebrum]|uniref:Uncharacterized protein n=1 Tax=Danionella cerebrum TaxID=2873325 RepID=A0A553MTR0_9TELE|nr:hypothetical protein DNTS_022803 [Danionella translucida]TRY56559.1 hypothetical protein DNTS_022803 [Danionella translucida]
MEKIRLRGGNGTNLEHRETGSPSMLATSNPNGDVFQGCPLEVHSCFTEPNEMVRDCSLSSQQEQTEWPRLPSSHIMWSLSPNIQTLVSQNPPLLQDKLLNVHINILLYVAIFNVDISYENTAKLLHQ